MHSTWLSYYNIAPGNYTLLLIYYVRYRSVAWPRFQCWRLGMSAFFFLIAFLKRKTNFVSTLNTAPLSSIQSGRKLFLTFTSTLKQKKNCQKKSLKIDNNTLSNEIWTKCVVYCYTLFTRWDTTFGISFDSNANIFLSKYSIALLHINLIHNELIVEFTFY